MTRKTSTPRMAAPSVHPIAMPAITPALGPELLPLVDELPLSLVEELLSLLLLSPPSGLPVSEGRPARKERSLVW